MANLRADNLTGTGGRNAIDGSVSFDGDHLLVSTSTDFDYGSNDFTIEFWWRRNTTERVALFHGSWGADWSIGIDYNGAANNQKLGFWASSNGTSWDMLIADAGGNGISTGTPDLNSWSHIAYVRYGNIFRGYLNGIEIVEVSSSSSIHSKTTTSQPAIGAWFNSESAMSDLHGYLSNFRIVKGSALYTANFTPPTEKLTAIDGTVLLCCQDSDDPTQEASGTGKTITGFKNLDITQAEKINGRFSGDPASNGWTVHSGASASYANGQWTVTSPSTVWKGANTSFTSVVGQQYRFTGLVVTSNNWGSVSVSGVGGGSASKIVYSAWHAGSTFPHSFDIIFTATSTTTYVSIDNINTTNNTVTTVQYVSVKPVEVGKAPKVFPTVGIDEGVTFKGDTKINSQGYMYFPTGDTTQRGRGRGFRFGGDSPTKANYIDYVNIQSQGTAQDFGDLLTTLTQAHAGSSSIRSIIFAGYNAPATVADIQYITHATQGNSIDAGINVGGDFGSYCNVVSSETRSVYGGGTPAKTATMEYVTNASLGSVTDFADFTEGGMYSAGTMNSTTRGIFAGGYYPSPLTISTKIQYITIATAANSISFGDLTQAMGGPHGICSSSTRGIMWDGANTIDYVTIATTGSAKDFGEATVDGFNSGVSFSSHTRACAGGGYNQNSPGSGGNANQNWIEYVTIATTGNAQDFGDLRSVGSSMGGSSDCHGGLS